MNSKIEDILTQIALESEHGERVGTLPDFGFGLPEDYVEFINKFPSGCEGAIGNSYGALWPAKELQKYNDDYGANEFAPELFLIGSDMGGEAYAIIKKDLTYVMVPFILMDIEDARLLGSSSEEFIETLFHWDFEF